MGMKWWSIRVSPPRKWDASAQLRRAEEGEGGRAMMESHIYSPLPEVGEQACPVCAHPRAIHGVYGCHEGDTVLFQEEVADLRRKAALFDEAWDALPVHVQEACEPDHAGDLLHAIGLLRRKAALFDALEKLQQAEIYIDKDGIADGGGGPYSPVAIHLMRIKGDEVDVEAFCAPTLAEAIDKALEVEGEGDQVK